VQAKLNITDTPQTCFAYEINKGFHSSECIRTETRTLMSIKWLNFSHWFQEFYVRP